VAEPGVSFLIPTLNAGSQLDRCLGSIRSQRYPEDAIEIVVLDGGSTDGTVERAAQHGATVVPNPEVRAEPGVKLGLRRASHDLRVVLAADNALPHPGWVRQVVAAFDGARAAGVYTHVAAAPGDSLTCRYFNRLHADPFNWFVFGARRSHPGRFGEVYPVRDSGPGWVVYDLGAGDPPLLAMAQGFALRGAGAQLAELVEDDIAPVWEMIERGERLAYVDAGIWHETVRGFGDFIGKYHRRARAALSSPHAPVRARAAAMSAAQRRRRLLWIPYSLSVVLPLADAMRGLARDRDPAWLLHPLACVALTAAIARAVIEARLGRG
jgi:glycosyltransferase involved in cell wall biosynthesis